MRPISYRIFTLFLAIIMAVTVVPFAGISAQEAADSNEKAAIDCKYFSAEDILNNANFTFTSDVTTSLKKANGENYVNIKIPTGTYGNNNPKMSITAHNFDFNLVSDYKYIKLVYNADYAKTISMNINKYASPSVSAVETWFGSDGGANPKTTADGVETTYIENLTNLDAKVPDGLTADYTTFNLVFKLLGSGTKTTTQDYNLNIKYIGFFKNAEDAEAFVPPVPSTEGNPALESTYNSANSTVSTEVYTDFHTYMDAEEIYNSPNITFSNDMNVSLVTIDGEKYVKCVMPAGTYDNGGAKMTIAGHNFDFNLVSDYKYIKFVYNADYAKTMSMSINKFVAPGISTETWFGSNGTNPKTTADRVETTYIENLTNLDAKVDGGLTADYTTFNLVFKLLGSGNGKVIDTDATLYIKYLAFLEKEDSAQAFEPGLAPKVNLADFDTDSLVEDAVEKDARYIDLNVLTKSKACIVLPEIFTTKLVKDAPEVSLNLSCENTKITLSPEAIEEISNLGADVGITISAGTSNLSITVSANEESISLRTPVRVVSGTYTGDSTAVATVAGKPIAASGIVAGLPAVNTTLPATVGFNTNSFKEFEDTLGHWGNYYIRFVSARDLMNGVSGIEFAPNGNMTRAMALTVLMRLSEDGVDTNENGYTDVSPDAWYAESIEWAYQNDIIDTDITTARPDAAVTREELAGMIYKYAKYAGLDTNIASSTVFTDADEIKTGFASAVNYCAAKKIINGYDDGTFKPANKATRAEVCAMLTRFINAQLKGNELDLVDYKDVDFDEDNLALTFLAISDVHLQSKSSGRPVDNFEAVVEMAYSLAKDNHIDLFFLAGDLAQNPYKDATAYTELEAFKYHVDRLLADNTALVYCTGNHDTSEDIPEQYIYELMSETEEDIAKYYKYDIVEDCEYDLGNRHAVANGYHFLSVGYEQDIIAYCKPILDKITAEEPNKPVFVQHHLHLPATIYGTSALPSDITEFFSNYPQVVFFSGHTHQALYNPRAIWQGGFTAVETAATKYIDDNTLINAAIDVPVNAKTGENYGREANLVEVDKNGNIRFTMFNAFTNEIIAIHTLAAPNANNTHLIKYSDARELYSTAPVFPKGSKVTLNKIDGTNDIAVKFDQAVHEEIVWYYKMTFSADGEADQSYYFSSAYYETTGMPKVIDSTLYHSDVISNTKRGHSLTNGVTYKVTVTPYDVWDHAGNAITTEYTA